MLFEEKLYFITQNLDFQYTGCNLSKDKFEGIFIIDGEHIKYNKYNEFVNIYASFDIYYLSKKIKGTYDIRELPFYKDDESQPSRYILLKGIIDKINRPNMINNDTDKNNLKLIVKKFEMSYENNIFTNCCTSLLNIINTDTYSYNTDGLIFTSKDLGVGKESAEDSVKNRKYTWNHSFKWKPPSFNTIDFLIEVQKDNLKKPIEKIKNINGNIHRFYEIHLYVGFDELQHGYFNSQQILLEQKINKKINSTYVRYKAEKFYPTDPYDNTVHMLYTNRF